MSYHLKSTLTLLGSVACNYLACDLYWIHDDPFSSLCNHASPRRTAVLRAVFDLVGNDAGLSWRAPATGPDLPSISRHDGVVGTGPIDGVRYRRASVSGFSDVDPIAQAYGGSGPGAAQPGA